MPLTIAPSSLAIPTTSASHTLDAMAASAGPSAALFRTHLPAAGAASSRGLLSALDRDLDPLVAATGASLLRPSLPAYTPRYSTSNSL